MIIISEDLIITQGPIAANAPLIGIHNLVLTSNITTTTENASYPKENIANPATFLEWRGTAIAQEDLEFDISSYGSDVGYVGIARHNFGTIGATVTLAGDTGSGYADISAVAPADDSPIIFKFTPETYDDMRIRISIGTAVPTCAVVYIGDPINVERNLYVGHSPLPLNRMAKVISGRSENGNFLGRIVTRDINQSSASFKNITPSFYRTEIDPFVTLARVNPFFWAWRPSSYPLEAGFAWLTDDITPSNELPNGMMEFSFSMTGIVE